MRVLLCPRSGCKPGLTQASRSEAKWLLEKETKSAMSAFRGTLASTINAQILLLSFIRIIQHTPHVSILVDPKFVFTFNHEHAVITHLALDLIFQSTFYFFFIISCEVNFFI